MTFAGFAAASAFLASDISTARRRRGDHIESEAVVRIGAHGRSGLAWV